MSEINLFDSQPTLIYDTVIKKTNHRETFRKRLSNPIIFRFIMIAKLPMAFLAGIAVRDLNDERAVASIPFNYLTKNPFRSVYFACLSMAAELSAGVLIMMHTYRSIPSVSTLLVNMEGEFSKKATGRVFFTCGDGIKIADAIAECISTGEVRTVTAESTGIDSSGNRIAGFKFIWSFKPRSG